MSRNGRVRIAGTDAAEGNRLLSLEEAARLIHLAVEVNATAGAARTSTVRCRCQR
jgi:hypothetical protein